MCLFVIYRSSLVDVLSNLLPIKKYQWVLFSYYWVLRVLYVLWAISPLSGMWFANTFPFVIFFPKQFLLKSRNSFYCCSNISVSIFLLPLPPPLHYCPRVLYNCSCKPFTLFPWNSLPCPLWSLSAYSQFQWLWLYFACLFVLLIRFLLKVRSYGIYLFLPVLFHLYI